MINKVKTMQDKNKNHEIEKKAPAQPELSSRSDFRACFDVVVSISFDPVKSGHGCSSPERKTPPHNHCSKI